MSSALTSPRDKKTRPFPFGAPLVFGLGLLALIVAAAARARSTARLPVLAAAIVAALVPRRHDWKVRATVAVIAGLLALFVVRAWPAVGRADRGRAPRRQPTCSRGSSGCPSPRGRRALPPAAVPRAAPRGDACLDARDARRLAAPSARTDGARATTSTRTSSGCRASASTTTSPSTASRSGSCC